MGSIAIRQPLVLGQQVRAARKARGVTQVALADSVGTYPRAIIDLERGRSGDLALILVVFAALDLQLVVQSP